MIFPLLSVLAGCDNITTVKIDVGKVRITDKGDDDLSRVTIKCNNGVVIDADWKRNSASISPAAGEATIEDFKLLDHPKKVLIDWTPYEEKENELHAAFFDKGDISASANRTASPPPLLSSVKP